MVVRGIARRGYLCLGCLVDGVRFAMPDEMHRDADHYLGNSLRKSIVFSKLIQLIVIFLGTVKVSKGTGFC